MKKTIFILMMVLAFVGCTNQVVVDVFTADVDGYPCFRIPTITTTSNGVLIAVAEARNNRTDICENDIISKYSSDNGLTWSSPVMIAEDKNATFINPMIVSLDSGRVLFFYESFPKGYASRRMPGKGLLKTGFDEKKSQKFLMKYSDNDGRSWSKAKDLTANFKPDGYIRVGSPSKGIVLQKGENKGRIVLPFSLEYQLGGYKTQTYNTCGYSDDNGNTWSMGEFIPFDSLQTTGNEMLVAEADDGSIYVNSRTVYNRRAQSYSNQDCNSWSKFELMDPTVISRSTNAGLLRYSYSEDGGNVMLLSYNNHPDQRAVGTIAVSTDDGKTWPTKHLVVPGEYGYGQMTKMSDGNVGLLYEAFSSFSKELTPFSVKFTVVESAKLIK